MCGIAGIVRFDNRAVEDAMLQKLGETLVERGPDHLGFWQKSNIGFVHARLSIIDLSESGNQPFQIEFQGFNYAMTFNGEIYNFHELKKSLEPFNIKYRSTSDTEVLLWGYIHFGKKILETIQGMFAFSIHDPKKNTLFMARDHFGKKPLYYSNHNQQFIFSSDIRGIKEISSGLTLNFDTINYYLAELSSPQPYTIWKEVMQVKPGHFLIFNLESKVLIEESYFSFDSPIEKSELSFDESKELIEQELMKTIEKREMGDVPIGYFLSGGVDSGLIVAMAAQNSKVSTYSVGYEDNPISELKEAKQLADRYQTNHHELIIKPDIENDLEEILNYFGEPFADASAIPSYYVTKEMSNNVKVAISGDGGDENFGYQSYSFFHQADLFALGMNPSSIARKIKLSKIKSRFSSATNYGMYENVLLAKERGALYKRGMAFSDEDLKRMWLNQKGGNCVDFTASHLNNVWNSNSDELVTDRIIKGSFQTRLLNDYLVKIDRMSMKNSLEVRSPFLDIDFAKKMLQIPNEYKLKDGIPKYILKKIAEKWIDKDILSRKKKGFGVPVNTWLKNDLKTKVEHYLSPEKIKKQGFFDPNQITKIKNEFYQSDNVDSYKVWTLICFGIWLDKNI